MTRKLTIALAAIATLSVAALAPTSASAWSKHKHHHHNKHWGYGGGFYAPVYYGGPSCYTVKRIVYTYNGPRVRRVLVCN